MHDTPFTPWFLSISLTYSWESTRILSQGLWFHHLRAVWASDNFLNLLRLSIPICKWGDLCDHWKKKLARLWENWESQNVCVRILFGEMLSNSSLARMDLQTCFSLSGCVSLDYLRRRHQGGIRHWWNLLGKMLLGEMGKGWRVLGEPSGCCADLDAVEDRVRVLGAGSWWRR